MKGAIGGFSFRANHRGGAFPPCTPPERRYDEGVAICHVRTSAGSAARGQSAAAKSDYIEREGRYRAGREEVEHRESGNMPEWAAADPRRYWRAADAHERKNGRLWVEVQVALPNELDPRQRRELAVSFAKRLTRAERLPWTAAIHRGRSREAGRPDNPHAHILISERRNDGIERPAGRWFRRANSKRPERGGARKSAAMRRMGWPRRLRAEWERECNRALERAGRPERIDRRPLAEQAREALQLGDLERAAELSRDPEPKRGAGEGIEKRREAARKRGVPEEELPQASEAVRHCEQVRQANAKWRAECRRREKEAARARAAARAAERWVQLTGLLLQKGRQLRKKAESRVRIAAHALQLARGGRKVLDRRNRPVPYQELLDRLARAVRLRSRAGWDPARHGGRKRRRGPAGRMQRIRSEIPLTRSKGPDSVPGSRER